MLVYEAYLPSLCEAVEEVLFVHPKLKISDPKASDLISSSRLNRTGGVILRLLLLRLRNSALLRRLLVIISRLLLRRRNLILQRLLSHPLLCLLLVLLWWWNHGICWLHRGEDGGGLREAGVGGDSAEP